MLRVTLATIYEYNRTLEDGDWTEPGRELVGLADVPELADPQSTTLRNQVLLMVQDAELIDHQSRYSRWQHDVTRETALWIRQAWTSPATASPPNHSFQ